MQLAVGGGWTCLWCQKYTKVFHSTRALCHLAGVSGSGIVVCKAAIEAAYLARYKLMFATSEKRIASNKGVKTSKENYTAHRQEGAAVNLLNKRKKVSAATAMQSFLESDDEPDKPAGGKKKQRSHQPSIEASMQASSGRDIRDCNNALLSMAIADLVHCDNLADRIVESPRFRRMLKMARLVGNDYK